MNSRDTRRTVTSGTHCLRSVIHLTWRDRSEIRFKNNVATLPSMNIYWKTDGLPGFPIAPLPVFPTCPKWSAASFPAWLNCSDASFPGLTELLRCKFSQHVLFALLPVFPAWLNRSASCFPGMFYLLRCQFSWQDLIAPLPVFPGMTQLLSCEFTRHDSIASLPVFPDMTQLFHCQFSQYLSLRCILPWRCAPSDSVLHIVFSCASYLCQKILMTA